MMQLWNEAEARSHLLPPTREGLWMVLFLEESDSERAREVIARYSASVSSLSVRSAVVVLEGATARGGSLSSWFGLKDYPALGAVYNGMLLAIECDCEKGSCEAILQNAVEQYQALMQMHV